jgi:hypothetical protein
MTTDEMMLAQINYLLRNARVQEAHKAGNRKGHTGGCRANSWREAYLRDVTLLMGQLELSRQGNLASIELDETDEFNSGRI